MRAQPRLPRLWHPSPPLRRRPTLVRFPVSFESRRASIKWRPKGLIKNARVLEAILQIEYKSARSWPGWERQQFLMWPPFHHRLEFQARVSDEKTSIYICCRQFAPLGIFGFIVFIPSIEVTSASPASINVDIVTLGEYGTHAERLRLIEVESGTVIWELQATTTATNIRRHTFQVGKNSAQVEDFKTLIPNSDAFILTGEKEYQLEVWVSWWWLPFRRSMRF